MPAYLKFSSITGPLNPSGGITLPPGQPTGFGVDGSFSASDGSVSGLSTPSPVFAAGTANQGIQRSAPQDLGVNVAQSTASPLLFAAAAAATVVPRVALVMTAAAGGGIANEWVRAYWLLQDVTITTFQTFADIQIQGHGLNLAYRAMQFAYFANPSGGVLGTRTIAGWNWATNVPINA